MITPLSFSCQLPLCRLQVFHCHMLCHEDSGMMATLFIGKPHLTTVQWMAEHFELLVGVGLGVLVFSVLVVLLAYASGQKASIAYQPVDAMNELKSKAMD